jgi:hypothetical protein
VQTIQAKDITLAKLTQSFGLNRTDEPQFFREWQDNVPELTDSCYTFPSKSAIC